MLAITLFLTSVISYENPGVRLELFLKELSSQTGQQFHCPVYFKNEVLVASFQNQPLDVVKTQLARVVNGTWEERKDGWWLIQTTDQQREERSLMQSRRCEILKYHFDALKAMAPKTEWTAKEAERYWLDYQNSRKRTGEGPWTTAQRRALRLRAPESRFASAIAASLKPEMFDSDQSKPDFRNFTVRGLPNQFELPLDVSDSLRRYANEHELLQTIGNVGIRGSGTPVHFEVQCDADEIPFLSFSFFDKDWRHVSSALPAAFLPRTFIAVAEDFPRSVETQSILNILAKTPVYNPTEEDVEGIQKQPVYMAAVATLKSATKTDPLGILQGRCWLDFAKSRNKPLLANLEDSSDSRRIATSVPALDQPDFFVGMVRADQDGWVLGRPSNPLYNRNWRIDRSVVERIANLRTNENSSNLGIQLKMQDMLCYADIFSSGIPNGGLLQLGVYDYQFTFAALGTLSESQFGQCLKGDTILVTSLPERGQTYIQEMLSLGELNSISGVGKDPETLCPRYCFPKGLTGMRLGAKLVTTEYFSFLEPVKGLDEGDGMSLEVFAKGIKTTGGDASPMLTSKFVISTIGELQGGIILGPKSTTETLQLSRSDSPEYTWKTLPESIKRRILEAMKD